MQYLVQEWEHLAGRPNGKLQIQLNDRIKGFFKNYSEFNLYHFKSWAGIDAKIVEDFSARN
jgi:hypothetical protein